MGTGMGTDMEVVIWPDQVRSVKGALFDSSSVTSR